MACGAPDACPAGHLQGPCDGRGSTGTGPAAFYADLTQAVLTLAISAPPRPPGRRP